MEGAPSRRPAARRRSPPRKARASATALPPSARGEEPVAYDDFVWLYAERASQPLCFRFSCGPCGAPYATKVRFSPQESATIEACYLSALGGRSAECQHHRIDFATMRQALRDGSERDVYRERSSGHVLVGAGVSVAREATPCPHESCSCPADPPLSM